MTIDEKTGASVPSETDANAIPPAAIRLGWAGVIPFAGLSAALWFLDGQHQPLIAKALVLYAAVILSFMGGAQWGLAISVGRGNGTPDLHMLLGISVLPALIGWGAALLAVPAAIAIIAAAFLGLLFFDLWTVRRGLAPRWYANLRKQLTAAVLLCLAIAAIAV